MGEAGFVQGQDIQGGGRGSALTALAGQRESLGGSQKEEGAVFLGVCLAMPGAQSKGARGEEEGGI